MILAASPAFASPTLTKLHDFNNAMPDIGIQNPYDSPVLMGSELWFTSQNDGASGFGTFASFDLSTQLPTTRGGTGDRGTINSYDPPAPPASASSVLWNFPSSRPATNPNTAPENVAIIDRGPLGKDIYFPTSAGGPGDAGSARSSATRRVMLLPPRLMPSPPRPMRGSPSKASPRSARSSISPPSPAGTREPAPPTVQALSPSLMSPFADLKTTRNSARRPCATSPTPARGCTTASFPNWAAC